MLGSMKNGKLILQPMGGLANRMRIISVMSDLCKEAGVEFEVWWAANGDLGAGWEDLFLLPEFQVKEIKGCYIHAHRSNKWYKRLPHQLWAAIHRYIWLPYEDVYAMTLADTPENSAQIRNYWKNELLNGKQLFISSGDNLGIVKDLSMFKPIENVRNQVEKFLSSINNVLPVLYGMHVRRTDNIWAVENSPLILFEKKINDILKEEPDAVFYLATDEMNTIKYLQGKYFEKIVIREKDFSRGTTNGSQDALVDLLLLSRTKKIYGSHFSSFSEMASWLGNVTLEILRK